MICNNCSKMLIQAETSNNFIYNERKVKLCDKCEQRVMRGDLNGYRFE